MNGRRVDVEPCYYEPGDYGFWRKWWYCRPPWKHAGGCLGEGHKPGFVVTEHEDGTITADPSIRITIAHHPDGEKEWHGYLERGVWRECN